MRSARSSLVPVLVFLSACSSHHGDAGSASAGATPPAPAPLTAPVNGELITTPDITIQPGDEKHYCYYTSLSSAGAIAVKRYASQMTPGSHHMIVYTTNTATQPDGTLVECNDGMLITGAGSQVAPVWTYASQEPNGELDMPEGVGVVLQPRQPIIINMHYLNATTAPLVVHVGIEVDTFAPGENFTPAAAFATFNTQISVPPMGTQTVSGSCPVPPGSKFFAMSTHSHKYTVTDVVSDGDTQLFTTDDWEHPTTKSYPAPYYEFTSGKITYQCNYQNTTNQTITVGESASTNEMCMAIGYYFPATKSQLCLNDTPVSQ